MPNLPADNPTALLSLDELADFLNISRWAAYNLVSRRNSGIPALKIGREWRFRRSSIEQWISQIEGGRG